MIQIVIAEDQGLLAEAIGSLLNLETFSQGWRIRLSTRPDLT
jgi:hypothetical protein